MLRKIYYAKDRRSDSRITMLSHEYSTLVNFPQRQLVQSLQSVSVSQRTSIGVLEAGRALTVGDWKHQFNIAVFPSQLTQTALPIRVEPEIQKTYKTIASLGADSKTYKYTLKWLEQLRKIVVIEQMWWYEPLVNLGIDSEIVFEWWHENKKLTVYIFGDTTEYIKVWGSDIDSEMEDGSATSSAEIKDLWKWLVS